LESRPNKEGLYRVTVRVRYDDLVAYHPTSIKIPKDNFSNGKIVKHKLRANHNQEIDHIRAGITQRANQAEVMQVKITKEKLQQIAKGVEHKDEDEPVRISDYVSENLKDWNIVQRRKDHYKVIIKKIEAFQPRATFTDVDMDWLTKFEAFLFNQKLSTNTVNTKMSVAKAIFERARKSGLIKLEQFIYYKKPTYRNPKKEYLTEAQTEKFYQMVKVIEKPGVKVAGYYFLLGCYSGLRLSDCKRFNYEEHVAEGCIQIVAQKNKKLAVIPIYDRLQEVIDFVKDNPLTMTDPHVGKYIKEVFRLCGITKKLSFHNSRHTFGMQMTRKGFSVDQVAKMLADTPAVAAIYAQIQADDLREQMHKSFPQNKLKVA